MLLLGASVAGAQLVSGDWGYTNKIDGRPAATVAVITNYAGAPATATVPATIGGLPVRFIGNGGTNAIDPLSRLTGIVLPDSVTTIQQNAFYRSTNLASVTFGAGIQTIGPLAFGESGLADITVPNTVTSLGTYAFYKLPLLTNVVLGSGITNIGQATFAESTNLRSVTMPAGLKAIGIFAFNKCYALTNAPIPHGVTNIGDNAFALCTSLLNIVIPDSVLRVGGKAFLECAAATNLTLGAGLTNTINGTFAYCESLVSVTIPPGVTNIAGGLFNDCTLLESVVIGPGVTHIGDAAFGWCPALSSVLFQGNAPTIATNISGLPGNAFDGTSTNVTVHVLPGTSGWGATFSGRPTIFFTPRPALTSVSGDGFAFSWTGTGSIPMSVQRRTSLADGDWQTIATGVTAGAFLDAGAPEGGGFYRAVFP